VFPGLYERDWAAERDALLTSVPAEPVKPDPSKYLIRFQSARPVQAAIEPLLAMGENWRACGEGKLEGNHSAAATDEQKHLYDEADMITIAVIQRRLTNGRYSLLDYAFRKKDGDFPSHTFRTFAFTVLRTSHGAVHADLAGWDGGVIFDEDGRPLPRGILFSFPRLANGKPLISKVNQKVEFRMVVNQRVFEATFYVSPEDVLDGSEKSLTLNWAFTNLDELATN